METGLNMVTSTALSSAFSADEFSSSEATGEKMEQNEDDIIKSQEVKTGFHVYLFRMTTKYVNTTKYF